MKYFSNFVSTAAVLGCGLFLTLQTASATPLNPINGTLDTLGTFTISATSLDFCTGTGPCTGTSGAYDGEIGTGDLAIYTGGGTITDLSNAAELPGTLLTTPVVFMTFTPGGTSLGSNPATGPDIEFLITEVFAGTGTNANCLAGLSPCTPTGSAVTLTDTNGGDSSATISAVGIALNVTTGAMDPLQIVLTSQFNTPYSTVLGALASEGSVTSTYSGSFSATSVPEPSSLAMMGIGASLIFGAVVRRRRLTR
jgi:hypothetical protein